MFINQIDMSKSKKSQDESSEFIERNRHSF